MKHFLVIFIFVCFFGLKNIFQNFYEICPTIYSFCNKFDLYKLQLCIITGYIGYWTYVYCDLSSTKESDISFFFFCQKKAIYFAIFIFIYINIFSSVKRKIKKQQQISLSMLIAASSSLSQFVLRSLYINADKIQIFNFNYMVKLYYYLVEMTNLTSDLGQFSNYIDST